MLFRLVRLAVGLAVVSAVAPTVAPRLLAGLIAPSPAAAPLVAPASRQAADDREIALRADAEGHVFASPVINGLSFQMMVDTGATYVALTEESARRLGIKPARSEYTLRMATANGTAFAAPVLLDNVTIGGIRVRNVEAIVVSGSALGVDLLGMSFLKRLSKFELGGGQLVLVQ